VVVDREQLWEWILNYRKSICNKMKITDDQFDDLAGVVWLKLQNYNLEESQNPEQLVLRALKSKAIDLYKVRTGKLGLKKDYDQLDCFTMENIRESQGCDSLALAMEIEKLSDSQRIIIIATANGIEDNLTAAMLNTTKAEIIRRRKQIIAIFTEKGLLVPL